MSGYPAQNKSQGTHHYYIPWKRGCRASHRVLTALCQYSFDRQVSCKERVHATDNRPVTKIGAFASACLVEVTPAVITGESGGEE